MEWTVQRSPAVDRALPGEFFVNGAHFSFSLERADLAILAGRYLVVMAYSPEARARRLYTPDPEDRLPTLVDVPGAPGRPERQGIHVHAANQWVELLGCIAVGRELDTNTLRNAREMLDALIPLLTDALARGEETRITIIDPPAPGARRVNA